MGLFTQAAESVSDTGAKVATSTALTTWGLSSLPLSTIALSLSILLTTFYMWGAAPRFCRAVAALYSGLFHHDWALWRKLGDQPNATLED